MILFRAHLGQTPDFRRGFPLDFLSVVDNLSFITEMSKGREPQYDSGEDDLYMRDHSQFSPPPPDSLDDIQPDMLPPLSCPRLVDRPRELGRFILVFLTFSLLTAAVAVLIWLSGWVETEFEMTSVTSTREVRPVPKMLLEMVRDPTSLPVMYHGASKQGKDTPIQLVVLVESQASHSELRRAVRETWASPGVGGASLVIFTIAARGLSSDRMQQLERESRAHGDMAVFTDSAALPESEHLLYTLGWLQSTLSYQFLLRTRDRYYVRLEDILHSLQPHDPSSSSLYWGYFEANRHAKQRWTGKHWEPDWFLCSKFIRFAHSGGYVISQTLVERLVRSAHYLQLYMNEDIAMATWLSPYGDVTWRHDVRFDTDPGQSRGCQNMFLVFPVNNHGDMVVRHQRLRDSHKVCRKEHFLLRPHTFDFSVLPSQCCHSL